jgi:hypothetical protein
LPKNAPAYEEQVLEAFVAGAISGRTDDRARIIAELETFDGIAVNYEYYIKIEDAVAIVAGAF